MPPARRSQRRPRLPRPVRGYRADGATWSLIRTSGHDGEVLIGIRDHPASCSSPSSTATLRRAADRAAAASFSTRCIAVLDPVLIRAGEFPRPAGSGLPGRHMSSMRTTSRRIDANDLRRSPMCDAIGAKLRGSRCDPGRVSRTSKTPTCIYPPIAASRPPMCRSCRGVPCPASCSRAKKPLDHRPDQDPTQLIHIRAQSPAAHGPRRSGTDYVDADAVREEVAQARGSARSMAGRCWM